VLSPQSAERAQKQATADKLKFNLLVDANNEVGKAFGVVYTFPEDLKNRYWLELPSSFPLPARTVPFGIAAEKDWPTVATPRATSDHVRSDQREPSLMRSRDQDARGAVVLTSGATASAPKAALAAVATINAAIAALAKAFSERGIADGVQVNSVLPASRSK